MRLDSISAYVRPAACSRSVRDPAGLRSASTASDRSAPLEGRRVLVRAGRVDRLAGVEVDLGPATMRTRADCTTIASCLTTVRRLIRTWDRRVRPTLTDGGHGRSGLARPAELDLPASGACLEAFHSR